MIFLIGLDMMDLLYGRCAVGVVAGNTLASANAHARKNIGNGAVGRRGFLETHLRHLCECLAGERMDIVIMSHAQIMGRKVD